MKQQISKDLEKRLAKISEEQNFLSKNRYRLQKTKLDYADKRRMPVEQDKIKDVLRNRPTFKTELIKEIPNYDEHRFNPQQELGLLTYLEEASYGGMKDLVRDIGIHPDQLS